MEGLVGLTPFILIAVVFWFLLIRPQRKRQLALLRTQGSVAVGDEVMLGAGIVGRVAAADEEFLQLQISPGVEMKVARAAVVRVLTEDVEREQDVPGTHQPGPDQTGGASSDGA